MNRRDFEIFITKTYKIDSENPWIKYPSFSVFRHKDNKKWFAVIMTIDKRKLPVDKDGQIDIVNLKCDAEIIWLMRQKEGVFPAYHMNKEHWLSVCLDGSVSDDDLKFLLSLSYDITAKKK